MKTRTLGVEVTLETIEVPAGSCCTDVFEMFDKELPRIAVQLLREVERAELLKRIEAMIKEREDLYKLAVKVGEDNIVFVDLDYRFKVAGI